MMCSARSLGSARSSRSRAASSASVPPRRRVPASGRLVTIPSETRQRISGLEPIRVQAGLFRIEHERGGIDDPQGAVDIQRIDGGDDSKALAGDELEDIAGLDEFFSRPDHLLELIAGAVGGKFQGHGSGGVDLAEAGAGRLMEAGDDFVDPPAGIAIGRLDSGGADLGVGDDLDGLIDMIEDHDLAVEGEEKIGELSVVEGRGGELFALVIADRVVAGVADEAAGEGGEMLVAEIFFGGEEFLQVGEGIGGVEFARGLAEFLDRGFAAGDLVDRSRSGGDEAEAADFFAADHAFEEKGVLLAAEDFEGGDGSEVVGEELAVNGDDVRGGGGGLEFVEGGEIAAHGLVQR